MDKNVTVNAEEADTARTHNALTLLQIVHLDVLSLIAGETRQLALVSKAKKEDA